MSHLSFPYDWYCKSRDYSQILYVLPWSSIQVLIKKKIKIHLHILSLDVILELL